jgi:predicted phage terminase large subunit-like protein
MEKEMASRVLARRRLLPFVQRMNERYDAGWVHEDICHRLEKFSDDVAKGLSPRLMLLMPPRHGKSELASKNFPAWHLGRHPDHEFIACSYNLSLAMGFSRKVKQIIDDPSYQSVFAETRLDPNNSSTEEWGIHNQRGGYVAAGIGGPITGKGAHVLVIDDPVKNAEEADSADAREKIWEWYLSTAYTRLAPGGGVLVIQTWWHDDDLAGRLQQMMAQAGELDDDVDQFEVVKYPAIAERDEYLDETTGLIAYDEAPAQGRLLRARGEALHPSRYDLKKLSRIRALNRKGDGTDGRWWSALYQQNPVPDDGSYFTKDQFRRGPIPAKPEARVYIAWDFAISEKKQNDYTVGSVGLQDGDDVLHVAEVVRFKSGDAFFIVESILDLTAKWYSPSLILGFEDGQIFRAIEALLKKRMRERRIYPAVEVLKPITDKMARARALQGRMQQGMVSFNDQAQWYETVRAEMLRFPAGVHDDCVDSLAWMTQLVVGREPPRKPQPQRMKSWKDKLSNLGAGQGSHMSA